MSAPFADYDVVALTRDLPEAGLVRGQTGIIVLTHAPDAFEVEFLDDDGRTLALLTLRTPDVRAAASPDPPG